MSTPNGTLAEEEAAETQAAFDLELQNLAADGLYLAMNIKPTSRRHRRLLRRLSRAAWALAAYCGGCAAKEKP